MTSPRNSPDLFHGEDHLPEGTLVPAGERKYVTVLISDLSGYTALSGRLDPEELNEIMGIIFRAIDKIIASYDGFIEKFVGDAVVAFFGVPAAHEDDPVRAILAAREIHRVIASLHFQGRTKTILPLSMHSGISSGLVVTAALNPAKGNYGISGDTINLASRLEALAGPGDILVCADTFRQSEGYFVFEPLVPAKVKGRSEPVLMYRVLAAHLQPRKKKTRRALYSPLVGRQQELLVLLKASDRLSRGAGSVIAICGEAGTGKSRLVDEFKEALRHRAIRWYSGCAHGYSRNSSYAPIRDLLSTMLDIGEGNSVDAIQQKIEDTYNVTEEESKPLAVCLGRLYGIDAGEAAAMDPEIRKSRLHDAITILFTREAQRTPTAFFLEDIHWADPSSLDFIQTFQDFSCPALFIYTFRPAAPVLPCRYQGAKAVSYREIQLTNLTAEESRQLLKSLLKPSAVPPELERFILEKVEGNPFYLEEMLNTLLESGVLVEKKGSWQITTPLKNSWIPRTVHGVVAAGIDCLNPGAKRVLQVAAVAGKHFSRAILSRTVDHQADLSDHLELLEQQNLIRPTSVHPDSRYRFRHAIIQEVVYKSILKKERRDIHERIGLVMEQLLPGSIEAPLETLAFHFKHGTSLDKATRYLIHSARKSLLQYSVTEAHQYYSEAYELLTGSGRGEAEDTMQLIDLLNSWAPVFYFRGTFGELENLFRKHLPEAETLDDPERRGIFYVWLGASLWGNEQFKDAHRFLRKALELGTLSNNKRVNGYAHTWLAWTCVDLGRMEEGIAHGKEARALSAGTAWEHYPYFQSYDSDGYAYWALGACARVRESGDRLLALAQENSSVRGITWGNTVTAWGYMSAGDFASAIERAKAALAASKDPLYTQFPRLSLAMCYVLCGDYHKAKELLEEVLGFARTIGCRYLGTPSRCFLSVVLASEGRFSEGMRTLKNARRWWRENQALWRYTFSELIIGDIYAALARRAAPLSWSGVIRNALFLAKNLPFAAKHATHHYLTAIELAHRIGARVIEGQAYLSLGRLYKTGKAHRKAAECFSTARSLFKACEAGALLELAEQELSQMDEGKE